MKALSICTSGRISRLRERMREGDNFLITSSASLRYFSCFAAHSGVGIALITPLEGKSTIITDGRYKTQIEEEVSDELFDIVISNRGYLAALKEKLPIIGPRLHIEESDLSVDSFLRIKELWPTTEIIPSSRLILNDRAIKDDGEFLLIMRALRITERALEETLSLIKVGVSEQDIAAEISYRQKKSDAQADAFPLQVLAGEHSSWPHGEAGKRIIKKGDILQFDIGCVFAGYHSDLSRVAVVGARPTVKQLGIHRAVRSIQEEMISKIEPGVRLDELFLLYDDLLRGYGYQFQHFLGHGVGLEIHEFPHLSREEAVAEVGQVFTIEPGIYIPDWGGMRIEDVVRVTERGCEVLTGFSKNLLILDV